MRALLVLSTLLGCGDGEPDPEPESPLASCVAYAVADDGGNGTIERTWVESYDERGRLVREEWDIDPDGISDGADVREYDDLDRFVRMERDRGLDGVIDDTFERWFEGEHQVPSREEEDEGADGVADTLYEYTIDADTPALRDYVVETDFLAEWETDEIARITLTYDELGNPVHYEFDRSVNGVADIVGTYTSRAGNVVLASFVDSEDEWHAEEYRTWDGPYLLRYEYTLVEVPGVVTTYTWDCP
jgi:hypothetical protein